MQRWLTVRTSSASTNLSTPRLVVKLHTFVLFCFCYFIFVILFDFGLFCWIWFALKKSSCKFKQQNQIIWLGNQVLYRYLFCDVSDCRFASKFGNDIVLVVVVFIFFFILFFNFLYGGSQQYQQQHSVTTSVTNNK